MQTLDQLISGELKGITHLKFSCGLTEFPREIFDLADTLEILDLSNNKLSSLPENFSDLKKLKIAFFSENDFTELPSVMADCKTLTMIGFKSNKIKTIPENAFPVGLQWLILTNNYIEEIPAGIGKCSRLQKVAFAGNKLKALPKEMSNCKNLELLRISANNIVEFPQWLLSLPKLTWLAFSGNPCSEIDHIINEIPDVSWNDLTVLETLGEGASGVISKAIWNNGALMREIAIKVFKGEVTSDGYPENEMDACMYAGSHINLVKVVAKLKEHPQQKAGLVLELIPGSFKNLAGPPSFETCTRDTFKDNSSFSLQTILKISQSIASVGKHLHSKGIMHGDLYAHNTLIDGNANTIFGDFGAATIYSLSDKNSSLFERLDVRAFGCMMDDLLSQSADESNIILRNNLVKLKEECMNKAIDDRPSFELITLNLGSLN